MLKHSKHILRYLLHDPWGKEPDRVRCERATLINQNLSSWATLFALGGRLTQGRRCRANPANQKRRRANEVKVK